MEAIHRNGSPNRKTQLWRKRQVSRCCPAGAFSPLAAFVSPCFRTVFRRWYAVPLGYPCRRIMPDLVTVESPEKTRKINRILGSGYVVRASLEHVRDLPQPKRDGRSPGKQRQQVGRGLDIVGGSDPTT